MTIRRHCLIMLVLLAAGCGSRKAREEEMMVLKTAGEVPEAVQAIEKVVDTGGCIKADQIWIYASKNYEWDVSLTGDYVEKQRAVGNGEHVSVAEGHPRAMFRNLDLRAYKSISFRKSGLGVVPFIRIKARGNAVFIENPDEQGNMVVHYVDAVVIENDRLHLIGEKTPPRVVKVDRPRDPAAAPAPAPVRGSRTAAPTGG